MLKRLIASFLIISAVSLFAYQEVKDHTAKLDFLSQLDARFLTKPAEAQLFGILTEKDQFCSQSLFGTISKETCLAACPGGALNCVLSQTHRAAVNDKLDEDLECVVCDAHVSCYDYGLMYSFMDCWFSCEINPKKKCVNAVGAMGFSTGLPKDSDGVQCWTCIDKTDQCATKWPGTTWKTTCDATCMFPDKCVFVGVADGNDCYKCQAPPPPPKTCADAGYLTRAQCATCPPNKPVCNPVTAGGAVVKDESGIVCYGCFPKQKTCEEQGLKSGCAADETCNPVAAPNGLSCCDCVKKPKTCADFSMQDQPCQCPEDTNKIDASFNDGTGGKVDCCICAKNQCHPDMDFIKCYHECIEKGGKCEPRTRVRGGPDCYSCVMPEDEKNSCQDYEMPASCSPNPCSGNEKCVMIKPDPRKSLECAYCEPEEQVEDPAPCAEYRMLPSCAPCYQASMSCKWHKVRDNPELHCAQCLEPIDRRCADGLLEGQCIRSTCADGTPCTTVAGTCHICGAIECPQGYQPGDCGGNKCKKKEKCVESGHCFSCVPDSCESAGAIECVACPSNCENDPNKTCQAAPFAKGGEDCCFCKDKPKTPCPPDTVSCASECPQGQILVPAPGTADSFFDIYYEEEAGSKCCKCVPAQKEEEKEPECQSDSDCDDGAFCNGEETCNEDGECSPGTPPCTGNMTCNEETDSCEPVCPQGQYKVSDCGGACSEWGMRCVPADIQGCYDCKCPDGQSEGSCYVGVACGFGYRCEPKGMFCYECIPMDFNPPRTQTWVPDETVTFTGITPALDDWNKHNFEIKADYKYQYGDDVFTDGFESGDTSAWSTGATGAAQQPKKKTCQDLGYDGDYDACIAVCDGKPCTRDGKNDDFGTPCWKCDRGDAVQRPDDSQVQYVTPRFSGFQAGTTYTPTEQTGQGTTGGTTAGTTGGTGGIDDWSVGAGYHYGNEFKLNYEYRNRSDGTQVTTPQTSYLDYGSFNRGSQIDAFCDEEMDAWADSNCGNDCRSNEECVSLRAVFVPSLGKVTCYDCRKKPPTDQSELQQGGYTLGGPIVKDKQWFSGGGAVGQVLVGENFLQPSCGGYYFPESYCDDCEWDGGYCVPAPGEALKPGGPKCFDCVDWEECADYGLHCSCLSCKLGTQCVAAGVIEGARGNQTCYACMKNVTIEVSYHVFIIETPRGRYVLGNGFNPSSLTNFSPRSVMALIKADSPMAQNIQKLAQIASGGFSVQSIQEIGGMLQQMAKQRSFTDDCFKDFKAEDAPKSPPPSSGSGGGKSGGGAGNSAGDSGGSQGYGQDAMQDVQLDGPIIACGEQDGKDVLAIFDANGANVQTILKDQLNSNPNVVTDALSKAESAYQQFQQLKNTSPQGLLQKAVSMLSNKITSMRAPSSKKYKEPPATQMNPNDPLYWIDAGKKKSKVRERMKSIAKRGLGGPMKMGGGYLGAGSGISVAKQKKESGAKDQWGLREVGFVPLSEEDSAWKAIDPKILAGPNVVVAVIDSGFDMSHPDGPAHIWTNERETPDNGIDDDQNGYIDDVHGWNFLDNNTDLRDFKGHGTFVAGIIAAKMNNGIGIAGINPGAVIMPLKVANADGETNSLNIFRAINYAVNHGARVINISLGAHGISRMEQAAINRARAQGIFVAISSGNVNENIGEHGPASALGAFAVGSLDEEGNKSTISNWGANNGLIAPGENIYSLRSASSYNPRKVSKDSEFYYQQNGTSFSSPMVAATASLLLAKNPNLTPAQIEDILQVTAQDIYDEGWDGESGAGILDAAAALNRSPDGILTVKINRLQPNFDDRKKLESVDVYATVRGPFESFTVGVGKGKRAERFDPVAGPFTKVADNAWVTRINKDDLRGSRDWIVAVEAKDKTGQEVTARSELNLK